MTREEFVESGEALFGAYAWTGDMAFALRVNQRTVQRVAAGVQDMPVGWRSEILDMLRARWERLATIIEQVAD